MTNKSEEIDLDERFYIFDNFLTSNKHIIERGDDEWDSSKIFFQLAIEHADKSPLSIDADKFEEDGRVDFDYVRDVNRDKEIYISPLVAILDGCEDCITDIEILPDQNIVSYSSDDLAMVWDKNSYECIEIYKRDIDDKNNEKIYHKTNYEQIEILKKYNNDIRGVTIFDDIIIVSDSDEKVLTVLKKASYEKITILKGHDASVFSVNLLPNGNMISSSVRGTMIIWDKNTYKQIGFLEGHTDIIRDIKITDKNMLLSCSNDKTLRVWDINSLKYSNKTNGILVFDTVQLKNNDIISSSYEEKSNIWDSRTYKIKATIEGSSPQLLNNGDIATYLSTGFINIWDKETYRMTSTIDLDVDEDEEFDTLNHSNGDMLLYLEYGAIRVLDKETYEEKALLGNPDDEVKHINIMDNGDIITVYYDETVRIFCSDNYEQKILLEGYSSFEVLKNKDILLTSNDKSTHILSSLDYKLKNVLEGNRAEVLNDGNILIHCKNSILKIFNKDTYVETVKLDGYKDVEILNSGDIITNSKSGIFKIFDSKLSTCKNIINSKNKEESICYLGNFYENSMESKQYIYENCFKTHKLSVYNKNCEKFFQWHSAYIPELINIAGNEVIVSENMYGRILKVIKQKKSKKI